MTFFFAFSFPNWHRNPWLVFLGSRNFCLLKFQFCENCLSFSMLFINSASKLIYRIWWNIISPLIKNCVNDKSSFAGSKTLHHSITCSGLIIHSKIPVIIFSQPNLSSLKRMLKHFIINSPSFLSHLIHSLPSRYTVEEYLAKALYS